MKNRFIKNDGVRTGGTYKCGDCGKQTRETGYGESQFKLCAKCYATANVDNMESDGGYTDEEIAVMRAKIEAGDYNV